MVDDFTDDQNVYNVIDEMKADLKDKLHVIYSEKNEGAGKSRNKVVRYASDIGAPFILFNDSDDISDPKRLELVRKAFNDDSVNVVYTSFDVIDENDNVVPLDRINRSVREIIEGHSIDPVEGENAWIAIATKKNYTNLTYVSFDLVRRFWVKGMCYIKAMAKGVDYGMYFLKKIHKGNELLKALPLHYKKYLLILRKFFLLFRKSFAIISLGVISFTEL